MADRKKKQDSVRVPRTEERQHRSASQTALHGAGSLIKLIFGIVGTLLLVVLCTGIIFSVLFANYLQHDVLTQSNYSLDGISLNQTSYVYYEDKSDGQWKQLQRLYSTENRIWADHDEIPETLVNAAIAIEDKRFYQHQGVDWKRTISASLNLFVGNDAFGGSTITQQLIKNLSSDDDITVRRKLLEIFRALEFEKKYTKDEIMTWYLNTIYLGEGCYGVKSAANVYFAKGLDELTVAECACLIGITNNPYRYDPYLHPEKNRERQLVILKEMLDQELIDQATYDEAVAQKMVFQNGSAEDLYTCPSCGTETGEYSLKTETVEYTEAERETLLAEAQRQAEANGESTDSLIVPTSYTLYYCPNCGASIDPDDGKEAERDYSYFVDTVFRDVSEDLAELTGYDLETCETMVKTGGYTIYATIDPTVQAAVDAVYEDLANVPTTTSAQQLQSAIVVVDNESGDIVGMAGGVGKKEGSLTLNRATQSMRSPGSSIKPLTVYAPALDAGTITPYSVYADSPYKDNWPKNQSNTYSGATTVSVAVAKSLNTVAVKVLADLGVEKSFAFATEKLGMNTLVEKENIDGKQYTDVALAPLALGALTKGVTVREMTTAYATFPNNGVYRYARTYVKVLDSQGNVVLDNTQKTHNAMKKTTAWNMTMLLQNAVNAGTGTPARLTGMNVAGKTGTTSDDHDRYFAGYTPYYTACVWCGFDSQDEIVLTGNRTNPAIVMWRRVMSKLHEGLENKPFFDTGNMKTVTICTKSGLLASAACALDISGNGAVRQQMFADDVPTEYCTGHHTVQWCTGGHGIANEYCARMPGNSVITGSVYQGSSYGTCTVHNAHTVAEATKPEENDDGDDDGDDGESEPPDTSEHTR